MCILLVEDEPLIRMIVTEELSLAGFDVCEAQNGDEAASLIQNPLAEFEVLITDIQMPGALDGRQVAALLHARFPEVPIIYTTGRPDLLEQLGHPGQGQALLPKPFVPSVLLSLVRQMLRRS
jgi:DNA-binding response OmpR family regulator